MTIRSIFRAAAVSTISRAGSPRSNNRVTAIPSNSGSSAWSRSRCALWTTYVVTPFSYPAGLLEGGHEITARDLHSHGAGRSPHESGAPTTPPAARCDPSFRWKRPPTRQEREFYECSSPHLLRQPGPRPICPVFSMKTPPPQGHATGTSGSRACGHDDPSRW
jgi:hypothetical protein